MYHTKLPCCLSGFHYSPDSFPVLTISIFADVPLFEISLILRGPLGLDQHGLSNKASRMGALGAGERRGIRFVEAIESLHRLHNTIGSLEMFFFFQEQISDRLFMGNPLRVISASLRCPLKHLQLIIHRF